MKAVKVLIQRSGGKYNSENDAERLKIVLNSDNNYFAEFNAIAIKQEGNKFYCVKESDNSLIIALANEIFILEIPSSYTPIDPLTIPSLRLWLDTADITTITTVDDTKVSAIVNKATIGGTLVQATDGNRPTLPDGLGGAFRLGGTKNLTLTGITAIPQPFTVYVVYKSNNFVQYGALTQFDNNFVNGITNFAFEGATIHGVAVVSNQAWTPNNNRHYREGIKQIYSIYLNDAASTEELPPLRNALSINRSGRYHYKGNPGNSDISQFTLGGTVYSADADIYEVLIFNEKISIENDIEIKKYLEYKYALPYQQGVWFYGDSITEGYSGTTFNIDGFVAKVAELAGLLTYNMGISDTSVYAGGVATANLNDVYQFALQGDKRDIVVFSYGTNDANTQGFIDNYTTILQAYITAGFTKSKLIVCSPPYQVSNVVKYSTMIPAIQAMCTSLGITFIDINAHTLANGGAALSADGTHPNDAGHLVIANKIIEVINTII